MCARKVLLPAVYDDHGQILVKSDKQSTHKYVIN